jgi:hypothetical protein
MLVSELAVIRRFVGALDPPPPPGGGGGITAPAARSVRPSRASRRHVQKSSASATAARTARHRPNPAASGVRESGGGGIARVPQQRHPRGSPKSALFGDGWSANPAGERDTKAARLAVDGA